MGKVYRRSFLRSLGFLMVLLCALGSALAQSHSAYEQAESYVKQGNFDAAILILDRLVAELPGDLRALNLLGIALSRSGRREEADRRFRQALELNPRFYPALKNLAVNELELGHVEGAKRHFEEVLRASPKDPAVHFGLAQIDFRASNFRGAVAHYEQSGALLQDPRALLDYAESCVQIKQPAKAVHALEKLPPQAGPQAHFQAGLTLARADQYAAAARHFELARNGFPDAYQLGFNLTLAYLKGRNYSAAIRAGQEVISGGSRMAEMYSLLAQAYEGSGDTKQAYDALRAATEIDPGDEAAYLDLIALCIKHENYDLSLEIADIGIQQVPRSYRLRLQRGVVLAMRGRFEEAQREFQHSTELAPERSLGYVAWSLALIENNRVPEAVELLRRRNQQDDGDYLVNWHLAEALARLGLEPGGAEQKEAIHALERSIQLNTSVPQPHVLLGKLLLQKGETDRSIGELQKALDLEPGNVAAMYQLAQAYRKKGDAQRASELFTKVGKAKSQDPRQFARESLRRIVKESPR